MLDDMIDKAKKAIDLGGKDKDASPKHDLHHKRKELKDHGHKKVASITDEFDEALPIFERAGYILKNFEIELGISPKLIPHFHIDKSVTAEQRKAVLAEVRHRRIIRLMLEALNKAAHLHDKLKIGNLDFKGLELHVSALPTVRLLFTKK